MAWFRNLDLRRRLMDDPFRYYFQMLILCVVLGLVALGMCIMNIITHKGLLTLATGGFSVICFTNALLLGLSRQCKSLHYAIMIVAILMLFTYFLLTGGTVGFSPHWILLLPACGMLFFGRKRGFVVSAIMLVIIIALLWLPAGKSLLYYEYTPEFCMRFPVVYIAFFAVGYIYELIRFSTYRNLQTARRELAMMSETDALTGIRNRQWLNVHLRKLGLQPATQGLMIMTDLDDFKTVNDTWGHLTGDDVLVSVAALLRDYIGVQGCLSRWGGEEFFIYLPDCDNGEDFCAGLVKAVEEHIFTAEGGDRLHITVSVGAVCVPPGALLDDTRLFSKADEALYQAKNSGKNRAIILN